MRCCRNAHGWLANFLDEGQRWLVWSDVAGGMKVAGSQTAKSVFMPQRTVTLLPSQKFQMIYFSVVN